MRTMRDNLEWLKRMPHGSDAEPQQLSQWLTTANAYANEASRMHEAVAALKPQGFGARVLGSAARVLAVIPGIWDSAGGEEKFTKSEIKRMAAATKGQADRMLTTISDGLRQAEPALARVLAKRATDAPSWDNNVRETHSFLQAAIGRLEKIVGRKAGVTLTVGALAVGAAFLAIGSSRAKATENLGATGAKSSQPETAWDVVKRYLETPTPPRTEDVAKPSENRPRQAASQGYQASPTGVTV